MGNDNQITGEEISDIIDCCYKIKGLGNVLYYCDLDGLAAQEDHCFQSYANMIEELAKQILNIIDGTGLIKPHENPSFMRDEDFINTFIQDCCFVDECSEIKAIKLYHAFVDWFQLNVSQHVPSQKKLGQMIAKRFSKKRTNSGYKYVGLDIKQGGVA